MDESLIKLGMFLVGASSGALLKYMQDRRLLHMYGDLVRQLSSALQDQVGEASEGDGEAPGRLPREQAEKLGQRSVS